MAVSPSPSSTSTIAQSPPKSSPGLRGFFGSFFSSRNVTRTEESQLTQPETASQLSEVSQPFTSNDARDAPTTSYPPSSQEVQAQKTQEMSSDDLQHTDEPIFIARDFAGLPTPEILPFTVDERWVVHMNVPENPVPGIRERLAAEWEEDNKHLYRLEGNRADPRNAITKTWGGRSKAEDEELMRQLEQRAIAVERMKQSATALGLTPTEPNIGGPPRAPMLQTEFDREAAARADAYKQQCEAESIAAGHGPLVKTPSNSPPPERIRRGFTKVPPPLPVTPPPLPRQSSKRKIEESETEPDDVNRPAERSRKRRHQQPSADDADPGPSTPRRYSLRRPHTDERNSGTPSPKTSPKRKGKGKAKNK